VQGLYLSLIASFSATVALAFLLRPIARSLDFIDRPGGRKQHSGEVPVIGGLAMFVGLALGLSVLPEGVRPAPGFTATAFAFMCLGLLDDRLNLHSAFRLTVQLGVVLFMVWASDLGVRYVGAPFGVGIVIFEPWVSLIITMMLVVGAVNAFNMVDGIDGLAGSIGLVSLIAVAAVGLYGANAVVLGVATTLAATVTGFLLFNLPLGFNQRIRIFMGDAGSMLLGFSLAWLTVVLSQDPTTPVAPVTLLWFVAVPIFDMVSTAAGRIRRGQSPMTADNTHFHHKIMQKGYTPRITLVIVVCLAGLWAAVGLSLEIIERVPEWASLIGFVVAGFVTFFVSNRLPRRDTDLQR
jgi:UDP-GlcNAc:undecaprenyl-phosphate/decaprenyl-phosphate GlcNAc-1-phosphate transferase